MYGAKYLWLLAGRYPDNWWRVPDPKITCSVKDIEQAMDGFIGTDVLPLSTSDERTFGGLVSGSTFLSYIVHQIQANSHRSSDFVRWSHFSDFQRLIKESYKFSNA